MKKNKLILWSLLSALGVFLYTAGVSWLLFNGENLFGQATDFWGPLCILLLFVLSAAITGSLVLGGPVYLYFNGSKKAAVELLVTTIAFLFLITTSILFIRLLA